MRLIARNLAKARVHDIRRDELQVDLETELFNLAGKYLGRV